MIFFSDRDFFEGKLVIGILLRRKLFFSSFRVFLAGLVGKREREAEAEARIFSFGPSCLECDLHIFFYLCCFLFLLLILRFAFFEVRNGGIGLGVFFLWMGRSGEEEGGEEEGGGVEKRGGEKGRRGD